MRIIGQFHQADLAGIEHLALVVDRPDMLDHSTLSKKQRLAFKFLNKAFKKEIPWALIRNVVKEVLFWGEDDKVEEIEIRFFHKPEAEEFKRLWRGNKSS